MDISPEEVKDLTDISLDTKRVFIESVIKTFEEFYTVDDVNEQIEMMRSFGDDATAVINFAYGAVLAAHLDIAAFFAAAESLAARSDQE